MSEDKPQSKETSTNLQQVELEHKVNEVKQSENETELKTENKESKMNESNMLSPSKRLERFLHGNDAPPPMTLEFKNVCARVPIAPGSNDKKLVLNNISGKFKPGEFVALMGPSGAGKSTLLNTLGYRFNGEHSGEIIVNDVENSNYFKKYIGYVLQLDTLLPNLTVYETLETTANLRLSKNITKEKKKERIEDIIHIMGLNNCKNTMVQLCSGGEKKRISIANEMLINPSILFLDEPTSGLDSTSANSILNTLRELSNEGRTIICCIHQPSSQMFNKFDKLLLLSNGNTIYYGNIKLVTNYFDSIGFKCPIHYNPADYILELTTDAFESDDVQLQDKSNINRKLIKNWKEIEKDTKNNEFIKRQDSTEEHIKDLMDDSKWATTWLEQFIILSQRAFIHRRGNNVRRIQVVQMLLSAIIGGFLWFQMSTKESNIQNWLGATFFIQFNIAVATMYRGVAYFPPERIVVLKERQSKSYRLSSYYLSKALAEFPVDCLLPFCSVTIFYWMVGLSDKFDVYLIYICITMLNVFTAGAYGTFVGATFTDMEKAISALVIGFVSMMLLGGFYVKQSAIPIYIRWLSYLSILKYSYGSNFVVLIDNVNFSCGSGISSFEECNNNTSNKIFKSNMRDVYFNNDTLLELLLILFFQGVGWHILGYISLYNNTQIKSSQKLTNDEIMNGITKQPWQIDTEITDNQNETNKNNEKLDNNSKNDNKNTNNVSNEQQSNNIEEMVENENNVS